METEGIVYTHALWRVRPGSEEAFVRAWSELADVFSDLESPPLWGTLLRSVTEPNVFYSFGPWTSEQDVEHMRGNDRARAALAAVKEHCQEATPGLYRVVEHVVVRSE